MGLREDMGSWVLAAVPDGLWVLDADGTTVWANARMADLLGVPHDEVVGYSAFDALDDDGREGLREHLATLARSREPGADLDCLLLRPDGSSVWTQASHVPLVDAAGEHRGWLHRVRDHSEEQRLLDELRSREVRLAEAQAIARVGSWEREASDPLPTWSAELYRVFEVDPETFVPSTVSFIEKIHPDDRPGAVAAYEAMMAGGDPIDVDARLLRAPGLPTRWVRTRGYATFDDEGRMLRVSGTVQDITESKEAEQGLAFLSAMAGAANEAETLEEALLAADAVVRPFTQWPALLVSFPDPDGSGRLWHVDTRWEEVGPDKLAASERLAARAAAERRVVQEVGPAGNYLVSGPAVAGDRIACVVTSTSRATTPPRPAEVAIFTQMLALLASVSQREQAGNELASARDDALAASRAKSEFLATMSHEIRTPLNGVIGLSELLGRTELTPHQRRLAQGVDQAGRTLLSLVNDILDLSKIEAGRLDLEEVDFDPRLVLEQSVGLVAERASGKQVELVVSTGSAMPSMVRGDPVRFGQVVTNLVSNAVKFTHQGEVVVRADGEGDTVRVEVRDTGIGIEPEVRDRLFRAFSQADSSTTREYGGTGLGLAISKRIVEAVGGEIGVESQVGVGSTFWFTAPFAPAVATNPPSEAALREAVTGLRVLVVDDNATNRFIMTEQLQAWGVHVVAVDSAYDALVELDAAARRAAPYDVALLDYMMPGADGEQLARIIRSEERHRGLRLALLSSALEGDPEWLTDAGIESFLSKPVLPSRLLDLLATLGGRLDPAQVAAPAVPRPQPGVVRGRLLVAEDNPINQMVAEGVLRRLGYDLLIVENGAAAVAALADDPDGFDAILMDCQMPVMDGFDATRAVRAMRGDGGRIPIIAMTAATTAEERERCLEAGMDDFLSKPVVPDLIEAALDRWVK
ncbi:MAG: response regulator, partial [Nocardioides sp.]